MTRDFEVPYLHSNRLRVPETCVNNHKLAESSLSAGKNSWVSSFIRRYYEIKSYSRRYSYLRAEWGTKIVSLERHFLSTATCSGLSVSRRGNWDQVGIPAIPTGNGSFLFFLATPTHRLTSKHENVMDSKEA